MHHPYRYKYLVPILQGPYWGVHHKPEEHQKSHLKVRSHPNLTIEYSIDYLDKNYGVLSEEPIRTDSMIFSNSNVTNEALNA